jgi:hypothetical protein
MLKGTKNRRMFNPTKAKMVVGKRILISKKQLDP